MRLFSDSASSIDDPFLARAYSLALRGEGRTAPNPMVGCVIVAGDRVVGEGFHPQAGMPHAEVYAIQDAGESARGATAYVTLEPCAHHGKTPPCTKSLIAAGVAKVVIGMRDPSSVAGGGAEALEESGIEVVFADDPTPYAELNAGWLKRTASGLPFVTAKVGATLDGCVALAPESRSAITGPSGARVTAAMRRSADAVLVGASTVRIDDPSLTVREDGAQSQHQPLRVVLAGSDVPAASSKVFTDGAAPTLVLVRSEDSAVPETAEKVVYDPARGLRGVLALLGERGLNDILVEPGPRLLSSLWSEGLVDRFITVTAGGMAGIAGVSMFRGGGDADAQERSLTHRAEPEMARIVGDVAVVSWRLSAPGPV